MNNQIEEMASIIFSKINGANFDDVNDAVIALFNAGYRKQIEGEWVVECFNGYWHYDCPFCGDGYAQERKLPASNYCHNCGAKMKGGE